MTQFAVDFASTEPVVIRLELLTHPHIPRVMAGVNPRTILGREWWDVVRKQAYLANNYNCCTCGGNPDDRPLDAHKVYHFDYMNKVMTFVEVVALCKDCHVFIHSGCLVSRCLSKKAIRRVICPRAALLVQHGMEPFWFTLSLYRAYCKRSGGYKVICEQCKQLKWPSTYRVPARGMWKLVIGDKTFNSSGKEITDGPSKVDSLVERRHG